MNLKETLLYQHQRLWEDDEESFNEIIAEIPHEMANWQHESYQNIPQTDGWPNPGSVFWHTAHLSYYREIANGNMDKVLIDKNTYTERLPSENYHNELKKLHEANTKFKQKLSSIEDNAILERVAQMVQDYYLHDLWHIGQLVVIRRLLKEKLSS